jgi:hypothetical protein
VPKFVADSVEATGLKWVAPAFVGCQATSNTNQTIANNTLTAINWNTETFDSDGFHDNVTNNSRMTIPSGKGGKYLVTALLQIETNTSGVRLIYIYKNGSQVRYTQLTPTAARPSHLITCIVETVATDYLEIYVNQTSGTTQTYDTSGLEGEFNIAWLGA